MRTNAEPVRAAASAGVAVRVITDPQDLAALAERWDALLSVCPTASPFQTLEWLLAWWNAYGSRRRLKVLVAVRGNDLVAALPLAERRVGPFKVLTYLGCPRSDFVDALVGPQEEAALRAILEHLASSRDWDVLHLEEIEDSAALIGTVTHLAPRLGWGWRSRLGSDLPYVRLETTWQAYLAGRSRHFRKRLRRSQEKLATLGELEVVRAGVDLDSAAAIETISEIEKHSWKITEKADRLQSPADLAFARACLDGFARRGWLRLFTLRLDGRSIAFDLDFLFRNRAYWYGTGFDQRFASFSPGAVLLSRSMEALFSEGVVELNFLRGPEAYKARWCEAARRNQDLVVWRAGPRGGLAAWVCVRARWLAQRSSLITRLVRRVRRRGPAKASESEEPAGGGTASP